VSSGQSFYVLPKYPSKSSSGSTKNSSENRASSILLGFDRSLLVSFEFHRKSTEDPVTGYISRVSKNSSQIKPKTIQTNCESSQSKSKTNTKCKSIRRISLIQKKKKKKTKICLVVWKRMVMRMPEGRRKRERKRELVGNPRISADLSLYRPEIRSGVGFDRISDLLL